MYCLQIVFTALGAAGAGTTPSQASAAPSDGIGCAESLHFEKHAYRKEMRRGRGRRRRSRRRMRKRRRCERWGLSLFQASGEKRSPNRFLHGRRATTLLPRCQSWLLGGASDPRLHTHPARKAAAALTEASKGLMSAKLSARLAPDGAEDGGRSPPRPRSRPRPGAKLFPFWRYSPCLRVTLPRPRLRRRRAYSSPSCRSLPLVKTVGVNLPG